MRRKALLERPFNENGNRTLTKADNISFGAHGRVVVDRSRRARACSGAPVKDVKNNLVQDYASM